MAEALFDIQHKYINFLVNNVHSMSDLNGRKHYNVFVDCTANEEDAKYLCEYIDKYNAAYAFAKNNIVDGRDECERNEYSKIVKTYPINFRNKSIHSEAICDTTLLPYKKGHHMKYERVFLNPAVFKKAVATDADLLRTMTEFFANDAIYEYFDVVRLKRMKAGLYKGKDYLIEINGATENNRACPSLLREYKDIFNELSPKGPNPAGGMYGTATFDYHDAYSMLNANDKELLDIISEFRLKQIMYFKFFNNAKHDSSKLGISASHLDDDVEINFIKTFMGRRLYSNYAYFMRAKQCELSAKKLIMLFNNVIMDQNYSMWYSANNAAAPKVNFQATFWENLKKAKTASIESN